MRRVTVAPGAAVCAWGMLAASGGYSSRQGRRSVSPRSPARCAAAERVSTSSVCARVGHRARRLCRLFAFSVPAAPACAVGVVAGAKSLRARAPVPLRPPSGLGLPGRRGRRRRAAPSAGSRHPIFLCRWRLAPPGPLRRRRPAARSVLRPLKRSGGACVSEAAPLRAAPGRSCPAPHFGAPGRGFF